MRNYYFKYVVWDHTQREFNSFRRAQKYARKINEVVYLAIFHKSNTSREIYDDIEVKDPERIGSYKAALQYSFMRLTGELSVKIF